MKTEEKFTMFWGGPFSQWEHSEFELDGVHYSCAEQYMMAQKALLFGDVATHTQIMATEEPSRQKSLGRQVKGFDKAKWESVAKQIVYKGNKSKFTQNPHLMEALVNSAGTTIVEASPVDHIWGIGLSANDPRAYNRSQWLGTNWLGEVLTQLREDLIKKE